MTIDQAVRAVVREELATFKKELIEELMGKVGSTNTEVVQEIHKVTEEIAEIAEEKPKPKRTRKKKVEETPVVEETVEDPIEEEHIADATEAKYREKCAEEGINPDTGEPLPSDAPAMESTEQFLEALMNVINGGAEDKKEKVARKKVALELLKNDYSLNKFSEVEDDQFSEVYHAVVDALK